MMIDPYLESYCENLRNQHHEYITLEQLRLILRIAKRTASYLVTSGIIPAIDTGKKTWRYRIAIADVVEYLHSTDTVARAMPSGAVRAISVKSRVLRKAYGLAMADLPDGELTERFESAYADYPDVLTAFQAAEILV